MLPALLFRPILLVAYPRKLDRVDTRKCISERDGERKRKRDEERKRKRDEERMRASDREKDRE